MHQPLCTEFPICTTLKLAKKHRRAGPCKYRTITVFGGPFQATCCTVGTPHWDIDQSINDNSN